TPFPIDEIANAVLDHAHQVEIVDPLDRPERTRQHAAGDTIRVQTEQHGWNRDPSQKDREPSPLASPQYDRPDGERQHYPDESHVQPWQVPGEKTAEERPAWSRRDAKEDVRAYC